MSSEGSIYVATAANLLRKVDTQAATMAAMDDGLERGFAHLGYLLLEVSEMRYWTVNHETWRDYLKDLAPKARRSVDQLLRYFLTVRDLSDIFNAQQLETMGITKAMILRGKKDFAIVFPRPVIDAALDPKITVQELKTLVSKALKMPEDSADADWMECEMEFTVSPEERTFIEETFDIARHTEPLTKDTISKSAQMKDIMMKLCMEFRGSHTGDGQ